MKFVRLLFKSVFRNRLRSLLTVSSIGAALFLIATLLTLLYTLTNPPETPDSALRLITRHKISLMNALPTSYLEKIRSVEGVEAVIGSMWFGGVYENKGVDNMLAQFAVSTEQFFEVNPDMEITEAEKQAFLSDRSTAIVGRKLADRYGWKLGETVHYKSNLFPVKVELKIAGIYDEGGDQGSGVYFHWDYFNQAMQNNGIMGTFSIRASSPESVPLVAERVDEMFKNSTQPTKTETERAFQLSFVEMLGNVQLLISSICLAVIFAVVLIAANTMAMSIRERVREIGVLKALGFQRRQVLGLLISESLLLALCGALLGSWGAKFFFRGVDMAAISAGFVQQFDINGLILGVCAGLGVLIGVLAAGVPAWRAAQRPVLEALRNV